MGDTCRSAKAAAFVAAFCLVGCGDRQGPQDFRLAGVAAGDSAHRVRTVLGEPDSTRSVGPRDVTFLYPDLNVLLYDNDTDVQLRPPLSGVRVISVSTSREGDCLADLVCVGETAPTDWPSITPLPGTNGCNAATDTEAGRVTSIDLVCDPQRER